MYKEMSQPWKVQKGLPATNIHLPGPWLVIIVIKKQYDRLSYDLAFLAWSN